MPSSNNKKKPTDHKPSTKPYGSSWKTNLSDLKLPSGETCQVKRPGVQGLIKAGVLHSLDSLTAIVQTETIPKAQGEKPTPVQSLIEDPDKFAKMMDTVDKIVIHVVVQPKVTTNLVPILDDDDQPVLDDDGEKTFRELTDEERDPELVYVDYIDAADKMFIMNFAVGGSADLAEFRKATQALVGSVPDGEATAEQTE